MAQQAATGRAAEPMPVRLSAWAIYDVFETLRGGRAAVRGRGQRRAVARLRGGVRPGSRRRGPGLRHQQCARSSTGDDRARGARGVRGVAARGFWSPSWTASACRSRPSSVRTSCSTTPTSTPPAALLDVTIPGGAATKLPALPLEVDGHRFALTRDLPAIGADSEAVFAGGGRYGRRGRADEDARRCRIGLGQINRRSRRLTWTAGVSPASFARAGETPAVQRVTVDTGLYHSAPGRAAAWRSMVIR